MAINFWLISINSFMDFCLSIASWIPSCGGHEKQPKQHMPRSNRAHRRIDDGWCYPRATMNVIWRLSLFTCRGQSRMFTSLLWIRQSSRTLLSLCAIILREITSKCPDPKWPWDVEAELELRNQRTLLPLRHPKEKKKTLKKWSSSQYFPKFSLLSWARSTLVKRRQMGPKWWCKR